MIKIDVPLLVMLPRKTKPDRKYMINLNEYRNWHYIVSNQIKEVYKNNLKDLLSGLKFDSKKINLHFILRWGSKRRVDRSNVLSIHEKFFCDALTEFGCIPDDNDNFIESTKYSTGEMDRDNPRVEIIINQVYL